MSYDNEEASTHGLQSSFGTSSISSYPQQNSFMMNQLGIPHLNAAQFGLLIRQNSPNLISSRRVGIPPVSPYSRMSINRSGLHTSLPYHGRSSSQPSTFALDSLPLLSPSTHREPPLNSFGFMSAMQSSPQLVLSIKKEIKKPEAEVAHDLVTAYMKLDNIDEKIGNENLENLDSREGSAKTNGEGSVNERESIVRKREGLKRNAEEDTHHYGSMPPAPTSDSEFGNGDFSAAEMKKIKENGNLTRIALSDPKRAKRILANRQSAARSKERKLRYIAELEHKVQTLQSEANTLSAQLILLQRDCSGLTRQNNELKFRLLAIEKQAHLQNALNEALTAEVQRLKLTMAELSGDKFQQPSISPQMF